MATNSTGNTMYMLAQSYMPAQETQILINPNDESLSPWYPLKDGEIKTPEWTFMSGDLRCFH
jgi:dTDP-4-dehydrorhamnose 3,5-epimerase-like enzyme